MSAGHGHVDGSNKNIALLIAVLALVLAFSETLGKAAQTEALNANIAAANLWSFFQAKTIRQTTVRAVAESLEAELGDKASELAKSRIQKWKEAAERYQTEPETGEGRKELAEKAKIAEQRRDLNLAAYHHYELASAAVQIAIVLASASVVTSIVALAWGSGLLGIAGLAFCFIGFLAPNSVHLF
jgi:hypothetical protein